MRTCKLERRRPDHHHHQNQRVASRHLVVRHRNRNNLLYNQRDPARQYNLGGLVLSLQASSHIQERQ